MNVQLSLKITSSTSYNSTIYPVSFPLSVGKNTKEQIEAYSYLDGEFKYFVYYRRINKFSLNYSMQGSSIFLLEEYLSQKILEWCVKNSREKKCWLKREIIDFKPERILSIPVIFFKNAIRYIIRVMREKKTLHIKEY